MGMMVGLCTLELHIPDAQSLKGKRQVLSSLIRRLRNRFNVSVAEIDENDIWQKAIVGVACVANDTGRVNQILDQVLNFIRSNPSMELLQSQIEIL